MTGRHWLFFDLGYTLINEDAAQEERIRQAVRHLNEAGDPVTCEEFFSQMQEASRAFLPPFPTAAARHGLTFIVPYLKELEVPYPAAKPVLAALAARYRIGVIANQSPGSERRLIDWGLMPYVERVFASAEMGMEKPDARLFLAALEACGCAPEQAVMIGDRVDNDVRPAKALGFSTIWVQQGFGGLQRPRCDRERPDETVHHLEELLPLL